MWSYSDVTVNVGEKLSPSKHDILYAAGTKFDADQFLTKDLGLKMYGTYGMLGPHAVMS